MNVLIRRKKPESTYIKIYMYISTKRVMPLTRKTRLSGSSIVVTIPRQITEAYDIKIGDVVEITPLDHGEIRIKKSITSTMEGKGG